MKNIRSEDLPGVVMALAVAIFIVVLLISLLIKDRKNKKTKQQNTVPEAVLKQSLYHTFIRRCFEAKSMIHRDYMKKFVDLFESSDFKTTDSICLLGIEFDAFTTMILYLLLQRTWKPFTAHEAQVLQEYVKKHMDNVYHWTNDKWNRNAIKNRINDYNDIIQQKVKYYGQSLYSSTSDENLAELKSNPVGRCAVLFTDFVYFTLIDHNFVTMEDMRQVVVMDIFKSVIISKVMVSVIKYTIDAAYDLQNAFESELQHGKS